MRTILFITFMVALIATTTSALAQRANPPLPRFVSLKSSEANVRAGPGLRYQIKWVAVKRDIPLEVIAEFEQWRKIRDIENDEGWIHRSLLTSKRTVTTIGEVQTLYKSPYKDSYPVALIEPGVHARLLTCKPDWCRIGADGYKGWLERAYLWGLYPDEVVD